MSFFPVLFKVKALPLRAPSACPRRRALRACRPLARAYTIPTERLGVSASDAIFVDDALANVEAARAVGMAAIHFTGDWDAAEAELESWLKGRGVTLSPPAADASVTAT